MLPRRVLMSVAVAAMISLTASCAQHATTRQTASQTGDAENAKAVSSAGAMAAMATNHFVQAVGVPAPYGDSDIQLVPQDSVLGSVEAPPAGAKKVEIIACAPVGGCPYMAKTMLDIFRKLGWTGDTIISQAPTPQELSKSWVTALSRDPDAIIGIATPGIFIGKQLAEAKRRGILTIDSTQTPLSGAGFDGYIDLRESVEKQLLGYQIIADSKGRASVAVVDMQGFPDFGNDELIAFLHQHCPGCSAIKISAAVPDVIDPVRAQAKTVAVLNGHPDVDYVVWPTDSTPVQAALAAVRQIGKTGKVKVVTDDADPEGFTLLRDGQLPFHAYVPFRWIALATVDAVFRGLAKKPLPDPDGYGVGAALITPDKIPAGDITYETIDAIAMRMYDYTKPYDTAWHGDF